ncbi:hypothetical protein Vretimale_12699 [Volvox reticuliferus]|nr:hypothetical protein Vretimale_12699 [Volvox reticuliferus]
MFDKVAIRVRGPKAKLNFPYADYIGPDGQLITDTKLEQLVSEARKALLEKQRWLEANEDNHDGGKRRRLCATAGQGLEVQCPGDSSDRTPAALPSAGLDLGLGPGMHGSPSALGGAPGPSINGGVCRSVGLRVVSPEWGSTTAARGGLLMMSKPGEQMATKLQPLASCISRDGSSGGIALGPAALSILYGSAFPQLGFSSGNPQHQVRQQRQTEQSQMLLQDCLGGSRPGLVDDDRAQTDAPMQDGYTCPLEVRSGALGVTPAALAMQSPALKASAVAAAPAMNFCLDFGGVSAVKQPHGRASHSRSPMGFPETSCLQLAERPTSVPARTAPAAPAMDATRGSVSRTARPPGLSHTGGDLDLGSLISRFLGGVQSNLPAGTEIESLIPCADGSLLGYTFVRVPEGSSPATAAMAAETQAARQAGGCSCDGGGGGITEDRNADHDMAVKTARGGAECAPVSRHGGRPKKERDSGSGDGGGAAPECSGHGGNGRGGTAAGIFFRGTYRNLGTYGSTADALQACKACMTVLLEFKERLAEEAAAAGRASAQCEHCVGHASSAGQPPPGPLPPSPRPPAKAVDRVLGAEEEPLLALPSGATALAAHQQFSQRASQLQPLPLPLQRKNVKEEWQGLRDVIVQLQTVVQQLSQQQCGVLQPQYMEKEHQRRCSGLSPGKQRPQQQGRPQAAARTQTRPDREGHLSMKDMPYGRGDEVCLSHDSSLDDGNRSRQSRQRHGHGRKLPYAPQPHDDATARTQRSPGQQQSDNQEADGEDKEKQQQWRRRRRLLDAWQCGDVPEPPPEPQSAAQALEMHQMTQLVTSLSQLNYVQPRQQMEGTQQVQASRQKQQQALRQGWAQQHQIVGMHRAEQQQQQQQQQQQEHQLGRQLVAQQLELRHFTPTSTLPETATDVRQLHALLQQVQQRASDHTLGHSVVEACKIESLLQALIGGGSLAFSGGVAAGCFNAKPGCHAAKDEDVSRSADDGGGGRCARNPSGSCDSTDDAVTAATRPRSLFVLPLEPRGPPRGGGCSSVPTVAEKGDCQTSCDRGGDGHEDGDGNVDGCGLGSKMARRQVEERLVCRRIEGTASVPVARVAAAASAGVVASYRKPYVAQAVLNGDEYVRRHVF